MQIDLQPLYAYHASLMARVDLRHFRYMYARINWKQRMLAIKGPRGTGKTTLMLQHIAHELGGSGEALYATADHPWFYNRTLLDLAEAFAAQGGRYLYIDEVHRHPNWSRELKAAYDGNPDLRIVFSASSALDILRAEADLSRRVIHYDLPGMSFREFLSFRHGYVIDQVALPELLTHHADLARSIVAKIRPLPYFNEYLRSGYYPYTLETGPEEYLIKVAQTLNVAIDSDLAPIEGFSPTGASKMKRLLGVIAESVPFTPNISDLARKLDLSRDTVYAYLNALRDARILNFVSTAGKGNSALSKPDKVWLENPNLCHALSLRPDVGNLRETFVVGQLINAKNEVTLPRRADLLVNGQYTLEVGGRNKGRKQVYGVQDSFIVKDDIEVGHGDQIPLWMFGLLY